MNTGLKGMFLRLWRSNECHADMVKPACGGVGVEEDSGERIVDGTTGGSCGLEARLSCFTLLSPCE